MNSRNITCTFCCAALLSACGKDPLPPRSVEEFVDNPILLEATMVRCAQDRSKTKYEAECVNVREAANRLAAAEEKARRIELEQQSERKRAALRRTQEAKAAARRRTEEERRRREEAEYLGIFEELPPAPQEGALDSSVADNAAGPASPPPAGPQPARASQIPDGTADGNLQPPVLDEAPVAEEQPPEQADIEAIREELKRRQDSTG
jgi:hypothetical protein